MGLYTRDHLQSPALLSNKSYLCHPEPPPPARRLCPDTPELRLSGLGVRRRCERNTPSSKVDETTRHIYTVIQTTMSYLGSERQLRTGTGSLRCLELASSYLENHLLVISSTSNASASRTTAFAGAKILSEHSLSYPPAPSSPRLSVVVG